MTTIQTLPRELIEHISSFQGGSKVVYQNRLVSKDWCTALDASIVMKNIQYINMHLKEQLSSQKPGFFQYIFDFSAFIRNGDLFLTSIEGGITETALIKIPLSSTGEVLSHEQPDRPQNVLSAEIRVTCVPKFLPKLVGQGIGTLASLYKRIYRVFNNFERSVELFVENRGQALQPLIILSFFTFKMIFECTMVIPVALFLLTWGTAQVAIAILDKISPRAYQLIWRRVLTDEISPLVLQNPDQHPSLVANIEDQLRAACKLR